MDSKERRFLIFLCLCGLAGMLVGGSFAWIENSKCKMTSLAIRCSTTASVDRVINGMATGLSAGIGASIAIAVGQKLLD
ncbi:hypothetical protein F7734_06255 [Scytonema sp. UIC 10036]|nr:hypothetical protein [Scytonema sp. UIC 10036]